MSAVCLNNDLSELRSVLMDTAHIQFLGNAVTREHNRSRYDNQDQAIQPVPEKHHGALLEDSQI